MVTPLKGAQNTQNHRSGHLDKDSIQTDVRGTSSDAL